MSHRTEATAVTFIHNGGYDGTVTISKRETGQQMDVPFEDLKSIVADWVRSQIMRFAENAQEDEVLLRYQRLWPTGEASGPVVVP